MMNAFGLFDPLEQFVSARAFVIGRPEGLHYVQGRRVPAAILYDQTKDLLESAAPITASGRTR
jgi:hypothetical protein